MIPTIHFKNQFNKTKSLLDAITSNNVYSVSVTQSLSYPKSRDAIASKNHSKIKSLGIIRGNLEQHTHMTDLALTHCIGIFLDFHSKKLRSMHQVHLEGSFPPKGNIPNQFMCFKRFFIAYVLKLWKLKVIASGLFVFLYLSMLLKMNEVSLS